MIVVTKVDKKLDAWLKVAGKRAIEKGKEKQMNKWIRRLLLDLVRSVIQTRSIVSTILAHTLNDTVQLDSNVKRIERFIQQYRLNYEQIAIVTSFLLPKGKWELSIDRTNWEYGGSSLNILAVTVYVKGVGVPIWFDLLDNKGGNSNTGDRIDVLKKIIHLFGAKRIKCIYGDREFIGEHWIKYLQKEKISFCLRIKQDAIIKMPGQTRGRSADKWMYKRTRYLQDAYVYGVKVNVILKPLKTLKKNGQPDQLILITDRKADKVAMDSYRGRWSIEVFFQCLKSRGFNLEQTHVVKPDRLRKLFAVVCLAFVVCLATGIHKDLEIKAIPLCKHGYKRKSFFRYGLDELRFLFRKADKGDREPLEAFVDLLCAKVIQLPDKCTKQDRAVA